MGITMVSTIRMPISMIPSVVHGFVFLKQAHQPESAFGNGEQAKGEFLNVSKDQGRSEA
jgi:hypothetical protein